MINRRTNLEIQVNLIQDKLNNKRFIDFSVLGEKLGFSSKSIFEPGITEEFSLSLVQENELFWVIFDHPLQRVISNKFPIGLMEVLDLEFFENTQEYQGGIKIVQLSIVHNAAGVVRNFLHEKRPNFSPACAIFGNYNFQYEKCISCHTNLVFLPKTSGCYTYCPFGYKNLGGVCQRCAQSTCPET